MATNDIELIYIGDGALLGDVPTRNLTAEEVSRYGRTWLLESGLYAEPKPAYTHKPARTAHKTVSTEEERTS